MKTDDSQNSIFRLLQFFYRLLLLKNLLRHLIPKTIGIYPNAPK